MVDPMSLVLVEAKMRVQRFVVFLTALPLALGSGPRTATRVIRFLDEDGIECHGAPSADGSLEGTMAELIEGDALGERRLTGEVRRVAKLLSPIKDPPAIYGIGLNYPDHAHNVKNGTLPTSPIVFFKNRNSHNGPGVVEVPPASSNPDYEAELVLVFGKTCKDATADNALDCVAGYTAGNDVSARCWQANSNSSHSTSSASRSVNIESTAYDARPFPQPLFHGDFDKCVGNGGQWSFSKGLDTHAPSGPVFVHREELGDGSGLTIQMHLNGKLMQNASTSEMIFGVRDIVRFITTGTTVEPGTVVFTGTMGGVGDLRTPKVILQDGDDMVVSISKIGQLHNTVARKHPSARAVASRRQTITGAAATTSSAAGAAATATATRVIRFLDEDGIECHGAPSADGSLEGTMAELIEGDALGERRLTGEVRRVAKLLSPIKDPPAIYGIGLNYAKHAHQANLSIPLSPIVFFKNRNSLTGPTDTVVVPSVSTLPDYEVELAVVTRKTCKDVSYEDALDCVLGYTVANDVSARCWQDSKNGNKTHQTCLGNSGQWSFSKSFDTHCPLGPALVTKDELGDGSGLDLTMHLNGELMQSDSSSDMIFDVRKIIEFITIGTTVEAGTVILTGTPGGVGITRTPAVVLQDGDNMTCSIGKIGSISNIVSRK